MDRTEMDLEGALRARDEGIARSYDHAPERWRASTQLVLRELCLAMPEFVVDDVWEWHDRAGLTPPREKRAMAGVLQQGKAARWCRKTGRYRASRQRQCHANPRMIWESLIYKGSGYGRGAGEQQGGRETARD